MNYQVSINDFEGPMDLLLHLVKEMKMDIYEIHMSVIIEEYLKYIHSLQELNIDIASEFLIMALEESEFQIQSEEDLKNKLIAYQQYKTVTKALSEMEEKRSCVFTKVPENLKEYVESSVLENDGVSIDDLLDAFLKLQERLHFKEPIQTKITKREISVESRMKRIRHVLEAKGKVNFEELFEIVTKEYVVVTFLALLDMSKNREVLLHQDKNYGTIWIESFGGIG